MVKCALVGIREYAPFANKQVKREHFVVVALLSLKGAMSDNSSSTCSSRSGSSTNSWTMLSPEEAAESLGPVDDGTESLGDVPSLSEEVPAAIVESRQCEPEIPVETVLSEEGQQVCTVCQETEPAPCEGPVPSSPTLLSTLEASNVPLDPDSESQPEPPIIHDMVTSSPSDNEQLTAMPFVTHVDLVEPLQANFPEPPSFKFDEPELSHTSESLSLASHVECRTPESSAPRAKPDRNIHVETHGPPSDIGPLAESPLSHSVESPTPERPFSENIGFDEVPEESSLEKEDTELPEKATDVPEERESPHGIDLGRADTSSEEGDGLRRRNVAPMLNTSEDEEDEEVEFELVERKEEKRSMTMNLCIVGALVLLCLGSLFLSDNTDEMTEAEQNQDWLNDPKEMKDILDKLTQENQQISQLEIQLQAHKEQLDSALNAGLSKGNEHENRDLEQENTELKEELSSLPGLREELEMLRSRVNELSQITAGKPDTSEPPSHPTTPSNGQTGNSNQTSATGGPERRELQEEVKVKEELQRQKELLEESKKRLEGMKTDRGHKKNGGYQKKVRESLAGIQERLTEQVEKMGKRADGKWKSWDNGNKRDGRKGKEDIKDHGSKERKGQEPRKHGKGKSEGGPKERDEKTGKDWKANELNPHKEAWRKKQDDWEGKKDDRRVDRDKRKQERPWQTKKDSNHQPQPDSNHQPQPDSNHQPQPDSNHQPQPDSNHQPHPDSNHQPQPDSNHQPQPDSNHQPHPDSNHQPHPDSNHQPHPDSNHQPHPDSNHQPHPDSNHQPHRHHKPQYEQTSFWKHQGEKLGRNVRPLAGCSGAKDCAKQEGLFPVELSEFDELLDGYLSKLERATPESKAELQKLTAKFFQDGVFVHDKVLFSDFAEDVADILEDMADIFELDGQDDEALEEAMEEFEREALWKFTATV
ncbi:hypothetical protein DPEC_G00203780 [Dallia pectoralis]|uniref:Uncharacterized protein n=1 Tax=Dallia pectoralis TaxID=75939 RepID=A0ACC2G9T7_DALPE|nr:hypothetical protein DPEC_G00203780 [Dallia pectoralis]